MKSPFPGMDPYLESRCSDVHSALIQLIKEALQPILPSDLRARIDWRVYPFALRAPLPAIPIPLRENEEHVWVALQPLIERAYASGGHDDIDYSKPARPPLKGGDAQWADDLLKSAGRR